MHVYMYICMLYSLYFELKMFSDDIWELSSGLGGLLGLFLGWYDVDIPDFFHLHDQEFHLHHQGLSVYHHARVQGLGGDNRPNLDEEEDSGGR